MNGDFFLGSVLATCLTKLALRHQDVSNNIERSHSIKSESMLIMTSIIRAGKSQFVVSQIDEDSLDRILLCLRVLSSQTEDDTLKSVFLKKCRSAFTVLMNEQDVI